MIDYLKIQEEFKGLIGFRKSYSTADTIIDDELERSESGIFVNDLHDLFSIRNFDAIIQNPANLIDVNPYSQLVTYKKGDIVKNVDIFVSLADENINFSTSNTSKWKKTTLLSQYLIQKYNFSVNQVIQKFFAFKKELNQSKELLQRVALFDSLSSEELTGTGAFVGYLINVKSPLLANVIKRIGIQLYSPQSITIYLYHSSAAEPIKTISLDYTNAKRFQWFDVNDFVLKKIADNYEDGYFIIGYFESDLNENNRALNAKVNLGQRSNCLTCNYRNISLIDLWSKFFDIRPIQVQSQFLYNTNQAWAYDDIVLYEDKNWGLNLVLSAECDFTDLIIANKNVFIPVLSEQLRIVFLNSLANAQRKNQEAIESANLANHWLEKGGYDRRLQKALEQASFDLSDIDKNCLPCDQERKGIRHSAIW